MCACECVYLFVHNYVCMREYAYVGVYMHACNVCVCVWVLVCAYVCMCVCLVHVSMCVRECAPESVYIYVCVRLHTV